MPPAVLPLLFLTFASLFALSTATIPQQIDVLARFPSSNTLITTINPEITVNVHVYQNSNPQTTHDTTNSHSHLIRLCSFLTIAVNLALAGYLVHVGWGRYWCQTWEDQTGHVSQGCPVRHRLPGVRTGAVSAGTPTSADDSALPPAVHSAHDAPSQASPGRGRRRAAATAFDNGAPQHNVLPNQAPVPPSFTGELENESHSANGATRQNASGSSSSSRALFALVQAPLPSSAFPSSPLRSRSVIGKRARRPFRSGPAYAHDSRQQPTQQNTPDDIFEPGPRHSIKTVSLLATLLTGSVDLYVQSTPNVFEPTPHRSTRAVPLLASLYVEFNGLYALPTKKWFILVIAVPTETVHDPNFDLPFLQSVFGVGSANVCFEWIFGDDATPGNIRIKLCSLYRAAQESDGPSQLLVYLSGMGDGPGGLCIFGGVVITDQDIGSWLADWCAKSVDPRPTASIFLDVCRNAIDRQTRIDYDLALVRSCSGGQFAYAIRLGEGLPSSFFVISLFSASHDVRVVSDSFAKAFTRAFMCRMNQLEEYLRFIYYQKHKGVETCRYCPNGGKCLPPGPQRPEWEPTGLKTLVHFGKLIKTEYPDRAREVSNALAQKMIGRGFLKTRSEDPPAPSGSGRWFVSQNVQSTVRHLRGANQRTSQAAGFVV